MTDTPPAPPAGWYPGPDGQQRYWDGQQWLSIPAPVDELSASSTPQLKSAKSRRKMWIAICVAAAIVVIGSVGGVAWKVSADAAAADVAAQAQAAADAKVAADAKAAQDAQKRKDDGERAIRVAAIPGIEGSIKTMAEDHVTKEIIDGPVLDVSCSPVGGGSTDDLTERTTIFQCFVANKDNGDGTSSGYYYNATMNWDSGEYTYGLGKP